jgi:8-amino-7-oxononanoate synthase
MATLGKAAGVAGAFIAGDEPLVEWLLQKARSYTFATAPPPLLACALRASLRLIQAEDHRREHLHSLIARLREGLAAALQGTHWTLAASSTPIQPLLIGRSDQALAAMEGLRTRGLWVPAIRPPTVPDGTARLRIALSAAHTPEDVDRLVRALAEVVAEAHDLKRAAPRETA